VVHLHARTFLIDLKIDVDEKRKENLWYNTTRVDCTTAPLFFPDAYASVYHHLRFLRSNDVYRTTRHKTTMYNAYDSVCRIIYKTSSTCEGAMDVILCVYVGEKKKKDNIRKKQRERENIYIYIYIYKRSAVLILVSLVQMQQNKFA